MYCHVSLTIQLNISHLFTLLSVKTVLFQTIQFSIVTQFSSIWTIDWTLSGATTPGYNGAGSDGNKEVLRILQSFSITGALQSDCLVSYPGHLLSESYPSAEMQLIVFYSPSRLGE